MRMMDLHSVAVALDCPSPVQFVSKCVPIRASYYNRQKYFRAKRLSKCSFDKQPSFCSLDNMSVNIIPTLASSIINKNPLHHKSDTTLGAAMNLYRNSWELFRRDRRIQLSCLRNANSDRYRTELSHSGSADNALLERAGKNSELPTCDKREAVAMDEQDDTQTSDFFNIVSTSKDSKFDIDYLGESNKGDMTVKREVYETFENEGAVDGLELPIEELAKVEAKGAEALLVKLQIPARYPDGMTSRGIFCSRTLNLRSITTIGYDMDYTLIQYDVNAWEGTAYKYGMSNLRSMGFPVDGLNFDPELVIRGLIMDKDKGNLVKADRFGFVKRAMHGLRMISNRCISEIYGRELVDLRNESRWEFLNTLFSVSEAVMYMQMVERLDEGALTTQLGPLDYQGLHKVVAKALFRAHVEGQLKAEIINNPENFVELDPELPLALLDQKAAGKRLLLITNSDYLYTNKMMQYAFNQFLPNNMDWRDLFDMVIVSARKPEFFQMSHPLYEIVTEDGLMRPCFKATSGGLYSGGSAQMVEKALGFQGDETLYVGDHIYTDVSQSKVHLRWRTALICPELEKEVKALAYGRDHRAKLIELMHQKEIVGDVFNQLRLTLQRRTSGRAAQTKSATEMGGEELADSMQKLLVLMVKLDRKIAPMLEADGSYFNQRWGYLSRSGLWDKSHLTRQIEKYADIYTSRVSNFLRYTPFMYFRSQAQTLAHDGYPYS